MAASVSTRGDQRSVGAPPRLKHLALPLCAAVLQACSTCHTADRVNIRPAAKATDFELQDSQPYVTRLLIQDKLDARLGLCEPVAQRGLFVCLHLRVAPGLRAQWSQTSFQLTREGQPTETLPFPAQQYQLVCESRGAAPLKCPEFVEIKDHPDAPRELVNSGAHRDWRFEVWAYTVPPLTSFTGVPGDPDPPAWKLFSKYSTWQEYRLQLVPAARFDAADTRLELPSIEIAGKQYSFPPFGLKRMPTLLCPAYV